MQRVTVTLDDDLVEEIDRHMTGRGYGSRSEALRDLARAGLQQAAESAGAAGACYGALVYVYDHEVRSLARRLTEAHHHHHDLSVATLHVHIDAARCLEVALMRGDAAELRHLAEHVVAERGVRHGRLVLVPAEADAEAAPRPDTHHGHGQGHGDD